MIFDYMYKGNNAGDKGTLFQLKCRLNRKDVDEKVNKSYHGCESFFSTVVDGYVVFAAMEYFGMTSPDGNPTQNVPDADGSQLVKNVGEMVLIGYFMLTENLEDVFNYTIIGQKASYRDAAN